MKVTIVTPAHNEAAALPACLKALAEQQTNHQYKVIVVDNKSTDKTAEIAKSWQARLNLRVISEPKKGRGSARRRGFAQAKTDIILSTDADSIAPKNWIEDTVNALANHSNAAAVSGSSYIQDGTKLTNWTMKVGMPLSLRLYRLFVGHYMLTGANFALRRDIYLKAGGFDKQRDMLDDVDLSFRVARLGKILYLKNPKILTKGDIFGRGYLQGFWHYAKHLPSLLKKYGLRNSKSIAKDSL